MTPGPLRRILGLARRAADPTDDAGLLARFAANADADAFELLVWRHGGMVLGVCRRILGDAHAAEDAFQATFLALARRAKSVRSGGCVAAWLHRVARRVAVRARHSANRRVIHERQTAVVGMCEPSPPTDDLRAVLDEELDRLPERFRRAVVLCYLEGRSTAEAAERLGCPRGTVLSRLATARAKLKTRLLRRGFAPAILPPVIHGGLSEAPAALVIPTVRAAVANTATPGVIDLCDGVLRAMILSKLKLTTAVVLTVGMIGGGAGWVALTPGGPGVALAGGQAKSDAPRPESGDEQRRRTEEQAEKLRVDLVKAEARLADQEEAWAAERTAARMKLLDAEARLKRIELSFSPENRAKILDDSKNAREAVRQIGSKIAEEGALPSHVKSQARLDELGKQLEVEQKKLLQAMMSVEKRTADLSQEYLPARRSTVAAEEQLALFDRLTAMKRRLAQAQVEDMQDRLIQLSGGSGRSDPAERKIKDLERKLDDVLRELTELRRELRK